MSRKRYTSELIDELVPDLATGLNAGVVIFEDAVREPVLLEVLPDATK